MGPSRSAWLWNNPVLADCTLRLVAPPDGAEPFRKKLRSASTQDVTGPEVLHTQPGHTSVLASASTVLRARVTRWSQGPAAAATSPPNLDVEIARDQLDSVLAVLEFMYKEELPEVQPPVLLQVATKADEWEVLDCAAACLERLHTVELNVPMINQLASCSVPGITMLPAYATAREACRRWLVQRLGCAINVVEQEALQEDFLRLELDALRLWAAQDELVVDSENVLAHLMNMWWQKSAAALCPQLREVAATSLSQLLRVQHLSPDFLAALTPELVEWFRPDPTALAVVRYQKGNRSKPSRSNKYTASMPCAWTQGPRAAHTNKEALTMAWRVTEAQLQELHREAAAGTTMIQSERFCRAGVMWRLRVSLQSQGGPLRLGVFYSAGIPPFAGFEVELSAGSAQVRVSRRAPDYVMRGKGVLNTGVLQVPASEAPRTSSRPPAALWTEEGGERVLLIKAAFLEW